MSHVPTTAKTALIALTVLLAAPAALAAPAKPDVLALGTKNGAALRLPVLSTGLPDGGFRVTREGPGGPKTFAVAPLNAKEAAARFRVDERGYGAALASLRALGAARGEERADLLLRLVGALSDAPTARALGLLVDDANLAPGAYTYTVAGGGQTWRTTVAVGRDVPLAAPGGLKAEAAPNRLTLAWAPGDPAVLAYRVQRATGAGAFADATRSPLLAHRAKPGRFTDAAFDPTQAVRYRVVALDVFGRESAPSAPVTVEAFAAVPLPAPDLASARGGANRVDLAWAKVTDPRVTGIEVLRGDRPGKLSVLARLPAAATAFADTAAAPGRHHFYALRVAAGQNLGPTGDDRPARPYNPAAPAAPRALAAKGEENALTLTWAANAEPDVAGYNVYRAEVGPRGAPRPTLLNGAPLPGTAWRDAVPQGVQSAFRYTVRAVNTSGVEGPPSEAATAALLDRTPPEAPVLLRTEGGAGRVALVFDATPAPDLKAFEVYRAADDEAEPRRVATLPADSVGFLDADVRPGTRYSYAVRAVDAAGNASPASNVRAATTAPAALAAPAGVRATREGDRTRVTWTKVPGAAGYVVYRETNGKRVQVAGPLAAASFEEDRPGRAAYLVRAVGIGGEAGPLSKPASP